MVYQGPVSTEALAAKLDALADTLVELKSKVDSYGPALVSQARLEERQAQATEAIARAFTTIAEHQAAIDKLTAVVPPLVEARRWVLSGVGLAVTAVIAAMLKVVVYDPATLRDEVTRAMKERPVATQPK